GQRAAVRSVAGAGRHARVHLRGRATGSPGGGAGLMAELVFFAGTMDSGKSTLAMQMDYTHARRGRRGLIYTRGDRAGASVISSRLGLGVSAIEVVPRTDFCNYVTRRRIGVDVVDYLIRYNVKL